MNKLNCTLFGWEKEKEWDKGKNKDNGTELVIKNPSSKYMQDGSRTTWQYTMCIVTAEENELVLNQFKKYVHYGSFMLLQLHKALITKPNFVQNCPGYSLL